MKPKPLGNKVMETNDEEIVLCFRCGGKGFTCSSMFPNFSNKPQDYTPRKCEKCNGKGRLIKSTTTKYHTLKN